ncbi:discoidin domain-containing protein [Lysinibacillus capsici]|uniref:discoidin domain-containing protein n=1 Tax=Lysinibacillus capsici TaxID=2115968 RepID=UPI0028E43AD4|nr:discoidin domain-containing protein [Lysinibacillus capsici]MED4552857.1 discoidin domain-containing protein [Lysinibacillus capsici]
MVIKTIDYDYTGLGALGNLTTNSNSSFNMTPLGISGTLTDIYLKQSTTAPVAYKFFILNGQNTVVWISSAISRTGEDVKLEGIQVEIKKEYKIGIVGNSTTAYQGRAKTGSVVGYAPVSYGSINVGSFLTSSNIFSDYSLPLMLKVISTDNKTLILHEGEYKKWNPQQDATVDIYSENTIPIMTTNTSPSGLAFIDTQTSDSYRASYAFDRQVNTLAESNNRDGFIGYKFTIPKKINAYSIQIGSLAYSISNWRFQGSTDTTNGADGVWEDLHAVNYTFTASENKTFYFSNDKEYIAYRIKLAKAPTESLYSDFYEIGFYEKLSDGKPEVKPHWSTVSTTLSSSQFLEQGMDNLSPLLDRKVTTLEPMSMIDKSEILGVGEIGKVFSKTIDLKKYFDIRNVKAVDSVNTTGGLTFEANDKYSVITMDEYRKVINMTSNNTPAPFVASASGNKSSFLPWRAFDGATTGSSIGWAVSARTGWLQIDFGKTTGVSGFTLYSGKDGGYYLHDYSPSVFNLAGSHDGQKWEVIQDYTASWGGNNANNLSKEFTCKPSMYRYYRLNIDRSNNGTQIYVGEMFFRVFDVGYVDYPLDSKYLSVSKLNSIMLDIKFEDKKYTIQGDNENLTSVKLTNKPLSIKFD